MPRATYIHTYIHAGWGWVGAPLAGLVLVEYGTTVMFYIHAGLTVLTMAVVFISKVMHGYWTVTLR